MHSFVALASCSLPARKFTPVSADASWAFTSTHGSNDTGIPLTWAVGDVEDPEIVGVGVLDRSAVVVEAQAAATKSGSPDNATIILRNMEVVSLSTLINKARLTPRRPCSNRVIPYVLSLGEMRAVLCGRDSADPISQHRQRGRLRHLRIRSDGSRRGSIRGGLGAHPKAPLCAGCSRHRR